MPVGIPTPRHRAPSAHHTVASMREMSAAESAAEHHHHHQQHQQQQHHGAPPPSHPRPPPAAPWLQHGAGMQGVPLPPGAMPPMPPMPGMWGPGAPMPGAGQPPPPPGLPPAHMMQPSASSSRQVPPLPQWSMQHQWGGTAHPHVPPPPSMLTPGVGMHGGAVPHQPPPPMPMPPGAPAAAGAHCDPEDYEHIDSLSEGEEGDPQHGVPPMPPPGPPPGWGGAIPPPPGYPPFPWAPPAGLQQHPWQQGGVEGSGSEEDEEGFVRQQQQRGVAALSRRQRRMSGRRRAEAAAEEEAEGGSASEGEADAEKLQELYGQIARMRSTSPSRRQVANLRRMQKHMQEDMQGEASAQQQMELRELQRQSARSATQAAARQATHESTVRAIRREAREKRESTVLKHTESSRQKRSSALIDRSRSLGRTRTPSLHRTKSVPKEVPTPYVRVPSGSQLHTIHRSTSYGQPARVRSTSPPKKSSKRKKLHEPQNRNAAFVRDYHDRLTRTQVGDHDAADSSGEEENAVMSFLKRKVVDTKKERPERRKSTSRRGPRQEVGLVVPTEKDYAEGLEDLHQKLRKMYLELQRHPQRLLSQLTLQGNASGDTHLQSATEILSELDQKRPTTSPPPPSGHLLSMHTKQSVHRVRGEMEALEAQWDQLVASHEVAVKRDD